MARDRIRGTTPEVDAVARAMRRERRQRKLLWAHLRGRRLDGAKFRAQHAVGRFIFDFYCAKARLVIEVDGGIHRARHDQDADRDATLTSSGYDVVRFSNDQVLADIDAVLAELRRRLALRAGP